MIFKGGNTVDTYVIFFKNYPVLVSTNGIETLRNEGRFYSKTPTYEEAIEKATLLSWKQETKWSTVKLSDIPDYLLQKLTVQELAELKLNENI